MQFLNQKQQLPPPKEEVEKAHKKFASELEVIEKAISKAKSEQKELVVVSTELSEVKEILVESEKKLRESIEDRNAVEKMVGSLESEKQALEKKVSELKREISELESMSEAKAQSIVRQEETAEGIKNKIKKLEEEADRFFEKVVQKEQELKNKQHEFLIAEDNAKRVIAILEERKREVEAEVKTVMEQRDAHQTQMQKTLEKITDLELERLDAIKAAREEKENFKKIKDEILAFRTKWEKPLADKILLLDKREGDITQREAWVIEKEKSLINFRREMELELGRKINIKIAGE
jgi:chromosome segregation ATPase